MLPTINVVFYMEEDGTVPFLDWFESLTPRVQVKCIERITRLGELGYEMRRPLADYLRDGIYELRIVSNEVDHRILYFFHGTKVVVIAHGFPKKGAKVPIKQMNTAIKYQKKYGANPKRHTYRE